ncbi:uncharacterized protein LOC136035766 [Artemia franciscana]|uniref:uncharacterized protein LOC136035766 n=1 Tax=Artemia franciscana TaxID=6661 RepID=UPI0032DB92A0
MVLFTASSADTLAVHLIHPGRAVLSAVSKRADGEARAEAAGLQKKMESFLVIFQLQYIEAIMRVTNSLSQQLQAVDLVISRSHTLIRVTRSKLTDLRSGASFVSLFEEAKEFATELEIEVPAVNEHATRPSFVGQKGRPWTTRKITKNLKQFVTFLTLGKNFIESGNWTTTLVDEMKREHNKTFDRLQADFDRRFKDNLPVLSTLEAMDPSSTKFMDTELLKRFFALYAELDIDDVFL